METAETGAKLLLKVEEAARMLSLSRSKVFDLISKGEIPSVKINGSRRVPMDQLTVWVNTQVQQEALQQGGRTWSQN